MTKTLKPGKLFVISAPSGAGKTTLKDKLTEVFPNLKYSISATTRPMREGEVNGQHYYFKTLGEFEALIESGDFVEYNRVHNNYYGTLKAPIDNLLSRGYHVIFDLDVYGKINFDKCYPNAVGVLILPPSLEELERRLKKRQSEDNETLQLRLKNAKDEMEFAQNKGKYEYRVINDQLEDAVKKITGIFKMEMDQA